MWIYLHFSQWYSLTNFIFYHFRAYFEHFGQSKSTFFINWKLFSGSKSTWISIFIKVQLILVKRFIFFIIVLYCAFLLTVNIFCLKFNYLLINFYLIKHNFLIKIYKFHSLCVIFIWTEIVILIYKIDCKKPQIGQI